MKLSIETCATALGTAAINRKAAFQIELAVGLGLFLTFGGTGPTAKLALCEAYATAGYQCLKPSGIDYKTINRRINATADLYHKVDARTWSGGKNEEVLIRALMIGLEPFELHSVSDVHRFCAPPKPSRTVPVSPHTRVLTGATGKPNHTGQDKVISMFRRATDQVLKGADHIETEHLAIVIPPETTRDELIELAAKLIAMAESKKELLTA